MIRAFIAVNLPAEIKRSIAGLQHDLQGALTGDAVRWVRPAQIHLTLKFLGDVPAGAVDDWRAALARAAESVPPFRLRSGGLGCFPAPRDPRVLWIGLAGDVDQLEKLRENIEAQTRSFSCRDATEDFHPHLTLARFKDLNASTRRQLDEVMAAHGRFQTAEWTVENVDMMRSVLSPQGAQHGCLVRVPLGTRPA